MKKNLTLNIKDLALLKSNPQEYYDLTKSYSHAPHLAEMPYDRNSHELAELGARYIKLTEKENECKEKMNDLHNQIMENWEKEEEAYVKGLEHRNEMKELSQEMKEHSKKYSDPAGDYKEELYKKITDEVQVLRPQLKDLVKRIDDLPYLGLYGYCDEKKKGKIEGIIKDMERIKDIPKYKDMINPEWIDHLKEYASNDKKINGKSIEQINKEKEEYDASMLALKRKEGQIASSFYTTKHPDLIREDYDKVFKELYDYTGERGKTIERFNFISGNVGKSNTAIENYVKEENLEKYLTPEGELNDKWYKEHKED